MYTQIIQYLHTSLCLDIHSMHIYLHAHVFFLLLFVMCLLLLFVVFCLGSQ